MTASKPEARRGRRSSWPCRGLRSRKRDSKTILGWCHGVGAAARRIVRAPVRERTISPKPEGTRERPQRRRESASHVSAQDVRPEGNLRRFPLELPDRKSLECDL